jgi:hypothetical protein
LWVPLPCKHNFSHIEKGRQQATISTGAYMSIVYFPLAKKTARPEIITAIESYRQKKAAQQADELGLGDKFTLIEDVHNPVIECNACKEPLRFTSHATIAGMKEAMLSHKCRS